MSLELITMLTWHDVTVENAKEIFLSAKDAPGKNWGFKIEGTTPESMHDLATTMKKNGKRVYIEVLAIDEESCVKAAKQCVEAGVDHMLGTIYYESVAKILSDANIAYSPWVGLNEETRLTGTIESITEKAIANEKGNVDGCALSAFRYVDGNPDELLKYLAPKLSKPFYICGSVNTYERMEFLKQIPNLKAFTIGGAFFENKFGEGHAEQITKICEFLSK